MYRIFLISSVSELFGNSLRTKFVRVYLDAEYDIPCFGVSFFFFFFFWIACRTIAAHHRDAVKERFERKVVESCT